jgi:hypothetical protein
MTEQQRRKTDQAWEDSALLDEAQQRTSNRFPYTGTCQLIPINSDGTLNKSRELTIVGRDLSATGLSFSHDKPLSAKHAVVTLRGSNASRCLLEVEITWSNRQSTGLYESGCRLIRNLSKPASLLKSDIVKPELERSGCGTTDE